MAIHFKCPNCGAPQTAEDRYAGLSGPCTACGQTMTVPAGAGMATGAPASRGSNAGTVLLILGIVSLVVLLGCGGLLVALLLPAIQSARAAAQRMQSSNNERMIMIALHNYHDTHGEFPPAFIADENGKPKHSWRVLILPFVEASPLYNQYDMNQPWDSPQNMQVANSIPPVYRSPFDEKASPGGNQTSYLLFAGKNTLFDGSGKANIARIQDGTSNTIALAEVNNSGVIWTQPTDLDAAQLDFVIRDMQNQQPGQINSVAKGGVTMSTFDGAVRFISNNVSPEMLRNAVNPSDGSNVNLD